MIRWGPDLQDELFLNPFNMKMKLDEDSDLSCVLNMKSLDSWWYDSYDGQKNLTPLKLIEKIISKSETRQFEIQKFSVLIA